MCSAFFSHWGIKILCLELSSMPQVKDGLKRAQNLLKQSQKRDYYKILGVKRSATTKQINKAYRKLAKEWHPDKYEGEDKEKAEKMFYDIAAAKEVLTDEGGANGTSIV